MPSWSEGRKDREKEETCTGKGGRVLPTWNGVRMSCWNVQSAFMMRACSDLRLSISSSTVSKAYRGSAYLSNCKYARQKTTFLGEDEGSMDPLPASVLVSQAHQNVYHESAFKERDWQANCSATPKSLPAWNGGDDAS